MGDRASQEWGSVEKDMTSDGLHFAQASTCMRNAIRESDESSIRLRRTSKLRNPHVISTITHTDATYYDIKQSSASLQSRGSAQSSIAYTRYCYSHPLAQRPCHLSKDHLIKCNPQLLQRYRLEVIDVD